MDGPFAGEFLSPYALEKLRPEQDLPGMFGEEDQKVELHPGQGDLFAGHGDDARIGHDPDGEFCSRPPCSACSMPRARGVNVFFARYVLAITSPSLSEARLVRCRACEVPRRGSQWVVHGPHWSAGLWG
jgi:hypothetical protein